MLWAFPMPASVESSATLDVRQVSYVGCDDGNLYSISPSGTIIWTFATGGPVKVTNSILALAFLTFKLKLIRSFTGKLL